MTTSQPRAATEDTEDRGPRRQRAQQNEPKSTTARHQTLGPVFIGTDGRGIDSELLRAARATTLLNLPRLPAGRNSS
jgi:hypothetical protein